NPEFQQSIKEFNEKVGGMKENLKTRTKETTEKLYKHVDNIWTEAEATTKKVSAEVKGKISAATEEVKETLQLGKESSGASNPSASFDAGTDGSSTSTGRQTTQDTNSSSFKESAGPSEKLYGWLKSTISSTSPKLSTAFQKVKDAKVADLAKKGYDLVKDELTGSPSKRKRLQYASANVSNEERSARTDIVVVPSKQSKWGKKWEAFKDKMQGHPIFKHISGLSEPVVTKGQEFAEDVRERWETSDNPVVHKVQE
ncbi:hypothetical protein Taro_035006, partial [Colocasia esculenta]|nr:hypothetical protein [Colocasia esculenta]